MGGRLEELRILTHPILKGLGSLLDSACLAVLGRSCLNEESSDLVTAAVGECTHKQPILDAIADIEIVLPIQNQGRTGNLGVYIAQRVRLDRFEKCA